MKLYIRQKVFSWKDKFKVYDESGNEKYYIEGELISLGKRLHVKNNRGEEVALIAQKLLSFLPRYFVYTNGEKIAEIVKKLTFLKHKYIIEGLGWEVNGNFLAHDYVITRNGEMIVTITKEWMTWGDCYELNIADGNDEIVALAVVLAIDCVMAAASAASSAN